MKKGQRQIRLCKCGCGDPTDEYFGNDGRFRGYKKYAHPECPRITQERRDAISKQMKGMNHPSALPLGTRRLSHKSRDKTSTPYWSIKVAETGTTQQRWKLEHRLVMEQILGRPLETKEHVHHINGDGLDNRPENLAVMSHSDHARLGAKERGFGTWDRTKPHRCNCCGVYHSLTEILPDPRQK